MTSKFLVKFECGYYADLQCHDNWTFTANQSDAKRLHTYAIAEQLATLGEKIGEGVGEIIEVDK